jgi:hypothetical protein
MACTLRRCSRRISSVAKWNVADDSFVFRSHRVYAASKTASSSAGSTPCAVDVADARADLTRRRR